MHIFDYGFLKDAAFSDILNLTNIIYDLNARENLRISQNGKLFDTLRSVAFVDSVVSSNAIEGVSTSEKRLDQILSGETAKSHDEMEILGYREALNEIYDEDSSITVSEMWIKHTHSCIMGHTAEDAGSYKQRDNVIQQVDIDGMASVRFRPVAAKETKGAMEQLCLAYERAYEDPEINKILLSACFVLDFLCIHPFTDGNGRVSRLLTAFLLSDAGFDIGKYISIDKKIEHYQAEYYDALLGSSDRWHENKNDYKPFIRFMLQILYQCYKELDDRFVKNTINTIPKNEQIRNTLLDSYVPVSKRELCGKFPDISVKTIENVLSQMVKEGKIEKIGTYKDARYRAK